MKGFFWGGGGGGRGEACTIFKFCLYGKTGLIFKPDTIIINHQLELGETRLKYLDQRKGHKK